MDEEILKKLIASQTRDYSFMHNLSHVPPPPITTQKLKDQLSKLRAYKCTSIIWCISCEKFRFIRSHHCKEMGACIQRMDHYCAFLDNCIGRNNHRYFMQYLTYTYLAIIWMSFELLWCNDWFSKYDESPKRL